MQKKFVMVTTEKKGVFAGILVEHDKINKTAIIHEAQMAIYWSPDTHGVLGLASQGPGGNCRISPLIPEIYLEGVVSVSVCTGVAELAWRAQPWG